MPMTLRPPMSTVEVAEQINAILGARVYSDKMVRAEIDEGRLVAVRNVFRKKRRHIAVTEEAFLVWARGVVTSEQYQRLVREQPTA